MGGGGWRKRGREEGGTCLSKQAASDTYVYGCQGILSTRGDGVQEQNSFTYDLAWQTDKGLTKNAVR